MPRLTKLQTTRNSLLNWLFQDKDPSLKDNPGFIFDMFVDHLEASYSEWKVEGKSQDITLQLFKAPDYDTPLLRPIIDMKRELELSDVFSHFLIHGSCADLNIVEGWSDFDSIAVLKASSLQKENRQKTYRLCLKLGQMMRLLDPYQHHGIHFIHQKELLSFPNLYLPVNLLGDSKCLLGSQILPIGKCNSSAEERARFHGIVSTLSDGGQSGIFKHHAKDGKYLLENYKDNQAMYQLKYFLCVIMLLPTLWFNLRGDYCRKEDSYEKIRSHFSVEQLEILESSSRVRSSWKSSYFNGDTIPDEVRNILGMNYLARGSRFAKMLEDHLDT